MDSSVTTSKSNKKWKRRKFLRCFRPPVDTDGFVRPKITGSDGDVDEYFNKHCIAAVGTKKESAVFPADQISSTASSTFLSSEDDDDEEDEGVTRPGKIGASRRISRALKAVLRDASMVLHLRICVYSSIFIYSSNQFSHLVHGILPKLI